MATWNWPLAKTVDILLQEIPVDGAGAGTDIGIDTRYVVHVWLRVEDVDAVQAVDEVEPAGDV